MSEKFLEKANSIIEKILKESSQYKKPPSGAFKHFVKGFYQYVSAEFLGSSSPANLYKAALSTWNFILERKSSEHQKVRVFNPTIKKDGWESQRTILEINIKDMPFLIDSVTAELHRQGFNIYQIIHPVLEIERDHAGRIINIPERASGKKSKAAPESVMHFEITHIKSADLVSKLEKDINNVLEYARLAVVDWKPMLKKLEETLSLLSSDENYRKAEDLKEVKDFLTWLGNNNFTFLGYSEYRFHTRKNAGKNLIELETVNNSELGIFKMQDEYFKPQGLSALPQELLRSVMNPNLIEITKSNRKSVVHRPIQMDYIGIKIFGAKGEVIGERLFLGLFTSGVYYQSATLIPIIRRKIDAILKRSGFKAGGHNGKALMTVLETYPRDELLQISEDDLFKTAIQIVELSKRPRVRLFARKDNYGRFMSFIAFVPRERFNTLLRERMQNLLESEYKGQVTDHYTLMTTDSPLARLHIIMKVNPSQHGKVNINDTERKLAEVANSWVDGLEESLSKRLGEREGENLTYKYGEAFPESFMARYHFGGVVSDIIKIEETLKTNSTTLDLYKLLKDPEENYHLKIYHPGAQVTLSEILPLLENMGFHGIDEASFLITPRNSKIGVWVHHFSLKDSSGQKYKNNVDFSEIKAQFEDALLRVQAKKMENDSFNKLILRAGMKRRDVELLRSYSKYLAQTSFTYSHLFMSERIARHPDIAALLVLLFYKRFNISGKKSTEAEIANLLQEIDRRLSFVTNVAEDRISRRFMDTVMATLRTNFFQKNKGGAVKDYISFKLDSAKVPDLPLPLPYAEIFVYAYGVEGIHLRGGKVARGGLRWSDRKEDFRTEVLGLMKAQMVKNSVIVPVGSKGGFVLKHMPENIAREDFMAKGIESYKTFLCGLLDITDNIIDGRILPPKQVIRYDNDDPYLVVAADKGTATFSDIANSVSAEYNFWLGDAFASGGSAGYDHKKMGITAKGAWISVRRHFNEMGMDTESHDFTCAGIGDMSGDVFGNGLLLSKHIKLVAAFNHMHIFLDPNPDPLKSFAERERLFNLPRSTWADYNAKLISKGGGLFERKAKTVKVESEIKKLLDLNKDTLTPDELIKAILRARVDLLWNGGIGTYVKSKLETNEQAGDRTNDMVRINGEDLRCKVVGEGGNLGFTQLGRIEYAINGGRINTDAIDNSAGVDCSDHEVNIKIALAKAVESKKLTTPKRNIFLAKMTKEVTELVLRDNFLQTQAISIAKAQGRHILEQQARLMTRLERSGLLDRKIEFLPNEEEIGRRFADKKGLTRPEIAVLLAYSKLALYNELVESNLPDDPYFSRDLALYFPQPMRDSYSKEIDLHPLRREIIATFVTNSMINRVGSTFSHSMVDDTGMKGCDVARSYTVARDVFNLRPLWRDIEALGGKVAAETQVLMFGEVGNLIERSTAWFLRNTPHPLNVTNLVATYQPGIAEVEKSLFKLTENMNKKVFEDRYKSYLDLGVPDGLAKKIAYLEPLSSASDIVKVAKSAHLGNLIAGEVYFETGKRLSLGWLRYSVSKLPQDNYWQRLSVKTLTNQIYDQQMRLAAEIMKGFCKNNKCDMAIGSWEKANYKQLERYDSLINDLKAQGSLDSPMLLVAINTLSSIQTL